VRIFYYRFCHQKLLIHGKHYAKDCADVIRRRPLFYWCSRALARVHLLRTGTRLYRVFNQLIPHMEHGLPQLADESVNVF